MKRRKKSRSCWRIGGVAGSAGVVVAVVVGVGGSFDEKSRGERVRRGRG